MNCCGMRLEVGGKMKILYFGLRAAGSNLVGRARNPGEKVWLRFSKLGDPNIAESIFEYGSRVGF